MPVAVIEAQALGKPAIVSDSGGLPEIVEAGLTGLVIPQRDAQAVKRAILELVSDPERLAAMGLRARERAERLFAIEGQAMVLRKLRDSLLELSDS